MKKKNTWEAKLIQPSLLPEKLTIVNSTSQKSAESSILMFLSQNIWLKICGLSTSVSSLYSF